MGRLTSAVCAGSALALAVGSLLLAGPAVAAQPTGPRVCPAEDFWVGAGWGADRGRRSHMGIDLGGKRGSRIFAIEDGVIDRTKRQSNGALQIVMKGESGAKFYYGHMDEVLVKGGQKVRAGDVIGLMGDTGSPGAVHLHFEFWRSGGESAAVDPKDLVTRVCNLDGAGGRPTPQRDPRPEPAAVEPAPARVLDPAIAGDVFTND